MAELKTLRAAAHQMRAAAGNLEYTHGTGLEGEPVTLGFWSWPRDDLGFSALPELPPLQTFNTPREVRDHQAATKLRRNAPSGLLKTLMAFREVMGEIVEADAEMRKDGFTRDALTRQRAKLGEGLLASVGDVLKEARDASLLVEKTRRGLAGDLVAFAGDPNRFLQTLDLQNDEPNEPVAEAQIAIQTAIFDAEIARALKPLGPADQHLLRELRALPKQLDDMRVLSAVFRVPAALLPFSAEELRSIAQLAFSRNWPKTAAAVSLVEEMIDNVRPVAGKAILMVGRFTDPENHFDAFRRVPAGLWALEPFATDAQARTVYEDLRLALAIFPAY